MEKRPARTGFFLSFAILTSPVGLGHRRALRLLRRHPGLLRLRRVPAHRVLRHHRLRVLRARRASVRLLDGVVLVLMRAGAVWALELTGLAGEWTAHRRH